MYCMSLYYWGYVDWCIVLLLVTVLFMLFSYPVHLHDSIIVWSHDICTCTFPFFTRLLGVLTPWICTSRYMSIFFTEQVSEEIMCIWGVRSLFYSIMGFFGTILILLFILLISIDSHSWDSIFILLIYS